MVEGDTMVEEEEQRVVTIFIPVEVDHLTLQIVLVVQVLSARAEHRPITQPLYHILLLL